MIDHLLSIRSRLFSSIHVVNVFTKELQNSYYINFLEKITLPHVCACPKQGPGFPLILCGLFSCVQWVKVRGDYSLCWYWWNCGPSCFKLSFHIFDSCINSCLAGRINKVFSKCFLEEILYIMRVQFPEYNDMKTDKEVNEFEFVIFFLSFCNTLTHDVIIWLKVQQN